MERSFGEDFAGVRIHEGSAARRSVAGSHARALALGEHIALGPEAQSGDRRTIAHELAHVVQQRHASTVSESASVREDAESAARRAADQAAAGGTVASTRYAAVPVVLGADGHR